MKKSIIGLSVVTFCMGVMAVHNLGYSEPVYAESNVHVVFVPEDLTDGSVLISEEGKVLDTTDDRLVNEVSPAAIQNNSWGRWVYYLSGRTGKSNFLSSKGHHFSWVSMGSNSKSYGYAGTGKWSYAVQSGAGKFQAGFGMS